MKKILGLILLIVSLHGFSQNPSNYQYRTVFERIRGTMHDSGLHVPRYNGTPTGVRTGVSTHAGAIGIDTANMRLYLWGDYVWTRLARYDELATGSRFGVEDARAGETRYFSGAGTHPMSIDSLSDFYLGFNSANGAFISDYTTGNPYIRLGAVNGSEMFSQDFNNYLRVEDGGITLNKASGDHLTLSNIAYNSGAEIVHLGIDTLTGRVYRKTAAGTISLAAIGSSPNANGATITGSTLNLQPASGSFGGVLTTGSQNIAGEKIFNDNLQTLGDMTAVNLFATSEVRGSWLQLAEAASFGSVTSGFGVLWVKNDGTLHFKNDANVDTELGSGGSGITELTGDVTAGPGSGSQAATIANNAVTGAKIALGSDAIGDIMYYNGTDWVRLAAGTAGQALISNGAAAPSWNTLGGGNIPTETWYQHYVSQGTSIQSGFTSYTNGTGAAASFLSITTAIDGWLVGHKHTTGTTNAGNSSYWLGASGNYGNVAINNSFRYNVGGKVRFEDLSDVTETFTWYLGLVDDVTSTASIVDGVYFTYDYDVSSGQFVCHTESNNSKTSTASGITVAADTDYELEVSVFNGSAYFFINKVLVHTETSTIPTGVTRVTSIGSGIYKTAGTTPRICYIEWLGYGKNRN